MQSWTPQDSPGPAPAASPPPPEPPGAGIVLQHGLDLQSRGQSLGPYRAPLLPGADGRAVPWQRSRVAMRPAIRREHIRLSWRRRVHPGPSDEEWLLCKWGEAAGSGLAWLHAGAWPGSARPVGACVPPQGMGEKMTRSPCPAFFTLPGSGAKEGLGSAAQQDTEAAGTTTHAHPPPPPDCCPAAWA